VNPARESTTSGSHSASGPSPRRPGTWFREWLHHIRHCLGWRLVFFLAGTLVILLGASNFLTLRLHQEHLRDQVVQRAVELGETVLSSTQYAMLENDQEHLQMIVSNVAGSDHVEAVRLFAKSGRIAASSREAELGDHRGLDEAPCSECHVDGGTPTAVVDEPGEAKTTSHQGRIGLTIPIFNETSCVEASCHVHPAEEPLLGVLEVQVSTASVETAMHNDVRQAIALQATTVFVICLVVGIMVWRTVHNPFHDLLDGVRRFGAGELDYRLSEKHAGELGQLEASFNSMAGRLSQARTELETWNHTLEDRVDEKTAELQRAQDTMVFTEKMVSLGRLAAIVAHEINNPLAGILVSVKLVRRRLGRIVEDETERAKTDETLAMIERETARSGDIVRNLLTFSRQRELAMGPEDLGEILERALRLVQHQVDLQGVSARLEIEDDLPKIDCDANQIQQACLAVMINAIDAMSDGGELHVKVGREGGEHLFVRVSDTGIGIPEEIRLRIFEPFFTTKEEGQGTGLGLSVMYGIVQRHAGRVSVDSEGGVGTTLCIVLPLHPADRVPAEDSAASETR